MGAGLSGISQAIQLRRLLGDELDLTIIDREDDIGGTWLNSTWPGAGVDIPIHLYSLYSDPSTRWENFFASQNEVLQYLKDCVGRHSEFSSSILAETRARLTSSPVDNVYPLRMGLADAEARRGGGG